MSALDERLDIVDVLAYFLRRRRVFIALALITFFTLSLYRFLFIDNVHVYETDVRLASQGLIIGRDRLASMTEAVEQVLAPATYHELGLDPKVINLSVISPSSVDVLILRTKAARKDKEIVAGFHKRLSEMIIASHIADTEKLKTVYIDYPKYELDKVSRSSRAEDIARTQALHEQVAYYKSLYKGLNEHAVLFTAEEAPPERMASVAQRATWAIIISFFVAVFGTVVIDALQRACVRMKQAKG